MNEDFMAFGWLCLQVVKMVVFALVLWVTIYFPAVFVRNLAERTKVHSDEITWGAAIMAIAWAIVWILN